MWNVVVRKREINTGSEQNANFGFKLLFEDGRSTQEINNRGQWFIGK